MIEPVRMKTLLLCALLAGLQPLEHRLCFCPPAEPQPVECSCCPVEAADSQCEPRAGAPDLRPASGDCRTCFSRADNVRPYQQREERPPRAGLCPGFECSVEDRAPRNVPAPVGPRAPGPRPAVLGPRSPPASL